MNDTNWEAQYNLLKAWANKKGYSVRAERGTADCILFEDKIIYINSQAKYEYMFYTLLHECGHLLTDNRKQVFLEEHPLYPSDILDKRVQKSKAFKVCLLSEELSAWRKGLRLAKRLDLYVDKYKYHNAMVDALWSYVESIT